MINRRTKNVEQHAPKNFPEKIVKSCEKEVQQFMITYSNRENGNFSGTFENINSFYYPC